jgi:hypothetical protein
MTWAEHGTHRSEVRTNVWLDNLKARNGLEHLGIDAKITLKRTFQKQGGRCALDLIGQDKFQWYALISMAMNVQVPSDIGKFLTNWVIIKFSPTTLLHTVNS